MIWPNPLVLQNDLEYKLPLWGELISGTKEAIQRLGIGVGMAFPGESGAPKRGMTVEDPRGFECWLTPMGCGGLPYDVSIRFPGREHDEKRWEDFAPGVRKNSDICWGDKYVGTGEALAASGLVSFDQLPGQPGMGKTLVAISPDGAILAARNSPGANEPGAKLIERRGKAQYELYMRVTEEEKNRRWEAFQRATAEWEARMAALPRPAPLIAFQGEPRDIARARRMARLRVVEGTRQSLEETTPTLPKPRYRTEGNVIRFPWTAA